MSKISSYVTRLSIILVVAAVIDGGAGADEMKVVGDGLNGSIELLGGNPFIPTIRMSYEDSESSFIFDHSFVQGVFLPRWSLSRIAFLELSAPTTGGEVRVHAGLGGLLLASENPRQRYLVDSDQDDSLANHIWYENSTSNTGPDWRMMQLTEEMGGTLYVDGPVTQNHSFDIAETFWEAEHIEPGELVAIAAEHPAAVRPTSTASQATMLGVASIRPGIVLGGGAFSLEALRSTWGDEIADEYQRRRLELESLVFAEIPQLRERAERLRSQASYETHLLLETAELEERPSANAVWAGYETARADHDTIMFDRTLQRFFKDRFAAVALAGRVPVKADASFGAIRRGDYLTSSPIPGVAMRASRPGQIVGTALESLSEGAGQIQVFVHRGWYGGDGHSLGPTPAARARPNARDLEIADLRSRLAALETRLNGLMPGEAALARSRLSPDGGSPSP